MYNNNIIIRRGDVLTGGISTQLNHRDSVSYNSIYAYTYILCIRLAVTTRCLFRHLAGAAVAALRATG